MQVNQGPIVAAREVTKEFPQRQGIFARGTLLAVDRVSIDLKRGECVGLVGESGSGKSTLANLLTLLERPTKGAIELDGRDVSNLGRSDLLAFRRRVQLILQDPYGSLNPRFTVDAILREPFRIHRNLPGSSDIGRYTSELLGLVGLGPEVLDRKPDTLSGGQRQRVCIARALIVEPDVLICDEPLSALDLTVQNQVLDLLEDLRARLGLGYLLISHDLVVVRSVADRAVVMYLGRIVESGTAAEVFEDPRHPYTQALISSAPKFGQRNGPREPVILEGEVPSAANPPSGCVFRTRCRFAVDECAVERPPLIEIGETRKVACCRLDEIASLN